MTITSQRPILILAIAFGMYLFAVQADAQCIWTAFSDQVTNDKVPLIFHGTATRVQQIPLPNGNAFDGSPQLLRFEVHRMWKGIAARNITIYNLMGSERPKISVGGQYLVFAFLIPLEGRAQLGLPKNGPDAFAASCASRESSNPFADELTDGDTGTIVGR